MRKKFLQLTGAKVPIILGPMYPCSNPELVAAGAAAGAVAVVQPLSLTFVHRHDFKEGIRTIQRMAKERQPDDSRRGAVGLNLLIEKSSQRYLQQQKDWMDQALDLGVSFFVTSLGNPDWAVRRAEQFGGGAAVFHDVVNMRWARKALDAGCHGLIAVNARAGGHAGALSPQALLDELVEGGASHLPIVCAGGVGGRADFDDAMAMESGSGVQYAAVQMGTRFIASTECSASEAYKQAIVRAHADDIVLTKKLTGVDVAVIADRHQPVPSVNPVLRWLLQHSRFKHLARTFLSVKSLFVLRAGLKTESAALWQAGKSVQSINSIKSCQQIIDDLCGSDRHL